MTNTHRCPVPIILFIVLAALTLLTGAWTTAHADKRVALVIGNSDYKNTSPLNNPASDATAMAEALEKVGFQLIEGRPLLDLDKPAMEQAINAFGNAIRGGDVALFYYSGHGIQVDGVNYLIPVTAAVDYKKDVKYQLVDANFILDEMQQAGNTTNIVILDACRINPFGGANFRAPASGLANMDAPKGSLIAYSTAPGRTARDGAGSNSPYTEALAKHILDPGIRVEDVFIRVRQDVDRATGGAQSPWEAYNLYEPFYFIPAVAGDGGAGGAVPDKESLVWQAIAKESDPSLFEDYLERYPHSGFSGVAKARLDKLKAQAKSAKPKPGDILREPTTGMEFVWVEGGCFAMGSPDTEAGRYEDEGPVHEVCVNGLWVGKTEVTNRQYRLFKAMHDSRSFAGRSLNGDDQPVVNVAWDDARSFAEWMSSKGGGMYRLPTEAEWEYAARGGSAASRFWGDNPADACAYANVNDLAAESAFQRSRAHSCDDRFAVSAPVGSYRANPYGLYDMLGNVREWCQDVYSEAAYGTHKRDNPAFAGGGSGRVDRGGSWSLSPRDVRAANRKGDLASTAAVDLGFRLVRMP